MLDNTEDVEDYNNNNIIIIDFNKLYLNKLTHTFRPLK